MHHHRVSLYRWRTSPSTSEYIDESPSSFVVQMAHVAIDLGIYRCIIIEFTLYRWRTSPSISSSLAGPAVGGQGRSLSVRFPTLAHAIAGCRSSTSPPAGLGAGAKAGGARWCVGGVTASGERLAGGEEEEAESDARCMNTFFSCSKHINMTMFHEPSRMNPGMNLRTEDGIW